MKNAHVLISGFVQGVGFRYFVRKNAQKLGLSGWVKNLPDKKVEAIFSGDRQRIEKMIKLCRRGSFLSEVENVDVVWEEGEKPPGFEVLR